MRRRRRRSWVRSSSGSIPAESCTIPIKRDYAYQEPASFEEWAVKYAPEEGGMTSAHALIIPGCPNSIFFWPRTRIFSCPYTAKVFKRCPPLCGLFLWPLFLLARLEGQERVYEHL